MKKFKIILLISAFNFLNAELPTELFDANILEKAGYHYTYHYQPQEVKKHKAKWTFITYMAADNNLAEMAVRNVGQMKAVPNSDDVNLIVQWDKPETQKTHRLKIENGIEIDVGSLSQEMGMNPAKELVECVEWVVKEFPAENYALILWSHGSGDLDRSRQITNWLVPEAYHSTTRSISLEKNKDNALKDTKSEKGILYDDSEGTYLSNHDMSEAMKKIKKIIGKEIDLLGMDACLMAATGVSCAVKDSAKYLVGSENVERGEGWPYDKVLTTLVNKKGEMSAKELATEVVEQYQTYYLNKDPVFTQSAINLSCLDELRDSLDEVILQTLIANAIDKTVTQKIIQSAHKSAIIFHRNYIDLYSFYKEYSVSIKKYVQIYTAQMHKDPYKKIIQQLVNLDTSLTKAKQAIKKGIIQTSGYKIPETGGISAYFPNIWEEQVDAKYLTCAFAKTTMWPIFLNLPHIKNDNSILDFMH